MPFNEPCFLHGSSILKPHPGNEVAVMPLLGKMTHCEWYCSTRLKLLPCRECMHYHPHTGSLGTSFTITVDFMLLQVKQFFYGVTKTPSSCLVCMRFTAILWGHRESTFLSQRLLEWWTVCPGSCTKVFSANESPFACNCASWTWSWRSHQASGAGLDIILSDKISIQVFHCNIARHSLSELVYYTFDLMVSCHGCTHVTHLPFPRKNATVNRSRVTVNPGKCHCLSQLQLKGGRQPSGRFGTSTFIMVYSCTSDTTLQTFAV